VLPRLYEQPDLAVELPLDLAGHDVEPALHPGGRVRRGRGEGAERDRGLAGARAENAPIRFAAKNPLIVRWRSTFFPDIDTFLSRLMGWSSCFEKLRATLSIRLLT